MNGTQGAKATYVDPEREAMKLPDGVTCDSCYAFRFCSGIGCSWSGRTECDYYPNRYRPAKGAAQPVEAEA